uniref:F-box domain-containing protein n=1 Tax=Heterorhabditis bacteriophora TaxID=37862 RepID=A0A1I7X1I6_HETBA
MHYFIKANNRNLLWQDTAVIILGFYLQISAADIRQLKEVSKELKWLIERSWRPAFYILPPNVQIRILTKINIFQTQMTSSEIRRMKLVSRDMKYLIERGGRHLTKQELKYCCIDEIAPGSCKVVSIEYHRRQHINLENFSQILAHSHISTFHMIRVSGYSSIFNSQYNTSLIVRNELFSVNYAYSEIQMRNTVLPRSSLGCHQLETYVILKKLCMSGASHFCDDDLIAGNYRRLSLKKCPLSEHGLRRILEEVLDCRRDFDEYNFTLQKIIDVDRLLDGLPNIQKITERRWTLRILKIKS